MPKTLLLADDSITIQKVVGITFANEDFEVTAVDNGEAALARARELRPDIILADVVMPRKNGYEVCEAVKSDPALGHIPVLLLAGTFEAFDEARARSARADGHIAKPFESQALIDKVRQLVLGIPPVERPAPVRLASAPAPSFAAPASAAVPPNGVPTNGAVPSNGAVPRPPPNGAARPAVTAFRPPPAQPLGAPPRAAPVPGGRPPTPPGPNIALPPPNGALPRPGAQPPLGARPQPPPGARPAPGFPLPGARPPPGASAPAPARPGFGPGPGSPVQRPMQPAAARPAPPYPGAARPAPPVPAVRPGVPAPGALGPGVRGPVASPPAAFRPASAAAPPQARQVPASRNGPAPAPPAPAVRPDPFGFGGFGAPPAREEDWSDVRASIPTPAPIAPAALSAALDRPAASALELEARSPLGPVAPLEALAPPLGPPLPTSPPAARVERGELTVDLPELDGSEIPDLEPPIAFAQRGPQAAVPAAPPAVPPQPEAAAVRAAPADGGEAVLREALSRASREVIERVVWEVVPELAERIIRENLDRLVKQRQG